MRLFGQSVQGINPELSAAAARAHQVPAERKQSGATGFEAEADGEFVVVLTCAGESKRPNAARDIKGYRTHMLDQAIDLIVGLTVGNQGRTARIQARLPGRRHGAGFDQRPFRATGANLIGGLDDRSISLIQFAVEHAESDDDIRHPPIPTDAHGRARVRAPPPLGVKAISTTSRLSGPFEKSRVWLMSFGMIHSPNASSHSQ